MDLRSVYIQEIMRVSDFLEMQRKVLRGLSTLAFGLYGSKQIVTVIPSTGAVNTDDLATNPAGMTCRVPQLAMYELASLDPNTWITLGADTTQYLVQGINSSVTDITIPLPSAGNQIYYVIEAYIDTTTDTTSTVLPFYPLIQTTTNASSTTSKIYVVSTSGMSVGDQVVVQGFAAAGNAPVFIATISSDGGGPFITISPVLTSAPGSGVTLRDVNPNSGVPLSGPANTGAGSNIDRVRKVNIARKDGTQATTATVPPVTSGRVGLYTIGPIVSTTTSLAGLIAKYGGTQPDGRTGAPFFPSLINRSHHDGSAGQANKINVDTELSVPVVKRGGDTMTGGLVVPGLVSSGTISSSSNIQTTAGILLAVNRIEYTSTRADPSSDGVWGWKTSLNGFLDAVSTKGLRWAQASGSGYIPAPICRIWSNVYTGNGVLRTITITPGFTPYWVFIFPGVQGGGVQRAGMINSAGGSILYAEPSGTSTGSLSLDAASTTRASIVTDGFSLPALSPFNVNTVGYLYIALG